MASIRCQWEISAGKYIGRRASRSIHRSGRHTTKWIHSSSPSILSAAIDARWCRIETSDVSRSVHQSAFPSTIASQVAIGGTTLPLPRRRHRPRDPLERLTMLENVRSLVQGPILHRSGA
jgi:hypothetical protein